MRPIKEIVVWADVLWAPRLMEYIVSDKEPRCIFCDKFPQRCDAENSIYPLAGRLCRQGIPSRLSDGTFPHIACWYDIREYMTTQCVEDLTIFAGTQGQIAKEYER